jgi:hypothetical protein
MKSQDEFAELNGIMGSEAMENIFQASEIGRLKEM